MGRDGILEVWEETEGTSLGEQDKLHNLRGPMQNKNTGPLFKFNMNFKKVTTEHLTKQGPCVTTWVAHP